MPVTHRSHRPDATEELADLLRERILVLDGAMGTMIQGHRLDEAALPRRAVRDVRPATCAGDNDLLSLTQPDVIRGIHRAYLEAGADIIVHQHVQRHRASPRPTTAWRTSATSSTSRPRALAREAARRGRRPPTGRATSPGRSARPPRPPRSRPTSTTPAPATSPSTSSSAAYLEEARGLVDGGADLLLIETIFDTLNAKAAIFALETLFEEHGRRWPVIVSGTITDASGRTLSGQVTEAFWNSVRHVRPLAVGLNCALGAEELRPYVAELSRVADCFVSAHPNAGLPNAFGEYDETPDQMAGDPRRVRRPAGWSTSSAAAAAPPPSTSRRSPTPPRASRRACCREIAPAHAAVRASSRSPITEDSLFVNVGERTNITGSARFRKLIKDGDYDAAPDGGRAAGRGRRAGHRRQHGRGHDRRRRRDGPLPQAGRLRARHLAGSR